jgi:hypothetical protein
MSPWSVLFRVQPGAMVEKHWVNRVCHCMSDPCIFYARLRGWWCWWWGMNKYVNKL